MSDLTWDPKCPPQFLINMAIKLPSHLHRSRHGTLHFRIAVPSDLRQHFVFKEFDNLRHAGKFLMKCNRNVCLTIAIQKNPPLSPEGKAAVSQNGYKGGMREALQELSRLLKNQKETIDKM